MERASPPAQIGAAQFAAALSDDVRANLLSQGARRKYTRGQIIQQRGDRAQEFWLIESGTVHIGRFSAEGKLTLFAVLGAGDSFGEQAFLGDFPRMVDSMAGSDAVLIEIGEAQLTRLLETDASAARAMLKSMSHMLQQSFDIIEGERSLSVPQRLAQAILRLCDADNCTITVTQQELADLVGVSRVALGQALAGLEKNGFVKRGYGEIEVKDRERLANFAA